MTAPAFQPLPTTKERRPAGGIPAGRLRGDGGVGRRLLGSFGGLLTFEPGVDLGQTRVQRVDEVVVVLGARLLGLAPALLSLQTVRFLVGSAAGVFLGLDVGLDALGRLP